MRVARSVLRCMLYRIDADHQARQSFFVKHLGTAAKGTLLDVGGGTGAWTWSLRGSFDRGFLIDGFFETYQESLAKAQDKLKTQAVGIIVGDVNRRPFCDGAVDKVLCTEVIEHVDCATALLDEIGRVLKTGGVAVLSTGNSAFIDAYHYPVSKALRKVLPKVAWNHYIRHGLFESMKRRGHKVCGFTIEDLGILGRASGLQLIDYHYLLRAGAGAAYFDLLNALPRVVMVARLVSRIVFALDARQKGEGIAVLFAYVKC